ncbi:MAG: diguanylate cyclase [Lachnospiraceae bacterium]|nr:diguanylate cyclase [Lachnospiraceae bacterium]
MQKTFIKYVFVIMTSAIFLILIINVLLSKHTLENQQYNSFQAKIEQIIHTLDNNRRELDLLKRNLDEDYLIRARAAAYVVDRQEEVSMDVSKMQYLARLLNVDELHVIDENGIIVSASVSEYVGIDMADHEQTRPFLDLLDSEDEDAYLIQEPKPNAAAGIIRQYVGVARKGQKGVVQVGFEPKRQLEAQSRNTYDYMFSRFPTDVGEELFVVDSDTGETLGYSEGGDGDSVAKYYPLDELLECELGAYKTGTDGEQRYVVSRRNEDVLICAAMPAEDLMKKLMENTVMTLIYLLFIEAAVILLLNYLVRSKVIDGIHRINEDLSAITNGNFDTTVSVSGNREFEELSKGINTMVTSIVSISNRISAIIEISGIPLAAFEYENGINHVFVTLGVGELLGISNKEVAEFCKNADEFDKFIGSITENPIEGETDVYQINDDKYVRIHMSESLEGKLGVITDVTADIMEKKRMRYENTHDQLTGLYKFQYFKEKAEKHLRELAEGEVCAVVMLDLDFFKGINDTFGHDVGDRYLQNFSAVMSAMPPEHFLTARRSGDEFCMMLLGCQNRFEIIRYMNHFYDTLRKNHVPLSETESRVISASAGFAWTSDTDTDISELLSHADEALYEVKRDTKGTYGEYTG